LAWEVVQPELWGTKHSAWAAERLSALGEITGGVAHDFRNILAVIDSALRLAERNISKPDRIQTFISGAREGVARGMLLTSQLLTFARQKENPTSAVDVNALLGNLQLFLKYGAGSSVRIDFELSTHIPKCLVDPAQFAAAILTLVINARDAMPHGGNIAVTTTQCKLEADTGGPAGAYVRVRVRDNGMGMADEVTQRIFESFFTTKGDNGTGLGVPQICAFMRHVGGRLSVESKTGLGTTFDLFFPAVEGDSEQSY
jgi:signal transduction histidine kinase